MIAHLRQGLKKFLIKQVLSADKTGLPTIRKHLDYYFVENDTEPMETYNLQLALVLLAILFGGAGLYLELTAKQQLVTLNKSAEEGSSSAAHINKQLSKVDIRINIPAK